MSPVAETADGDPLASVSEEDDPPPDSIVHPTRGRIDLTISTTASLVPDADVELDIKGVAQEPIDSGEVVLTLPTRALMDHVAGKELPDLPVKATWVLPAMAVGDMWTASYTVPGEAEGYYRVMVNAYTHGPEGGQYLFDDVLASAWMFISETDGRLTTFFDDTISAPVAGPAAGWPTGTAAGPGPARHPDYPEFHRDSVYLHVVYTVRVLHGELRPAVRARIWGALKKEERGWEDLGRVTVPEDGIVSFKCPKNYGEYLVGGGDAPDTYRVQGREDIANWGANKSHCGKLLPVEVLAHRYLPWRLLNLAADTLTKHFGHTRAATSPRSSRPARQNTQDGGAGIGGSERESTRSSGALRTRSPSEFTKRCSQTPKLRTLCGRRPRSRMTGACGTSGILGSRT